MAPSSPLIIGWQLSMDFCLLKATQESLFAEVHVACAACLRRGPLQVGLKA